MMAYKNKQEIDDGYVKEHANDVTKNDLSKVLGKEEEIDNKIANSGMLEKYSELGKLMLDMLKDYKNGIYRKVPWFTIGSIVFALLYVLNPFDIVPDFIPGLGFIDDFSVFTIAIRFVESDLHKYLDWRIEE